MIVGWGVGWCLLSFRSEREKSCMLLKIVHRSEKLNEKAGGERLQFKTIWKSLSLTLFFCNTIFSSAISYICCQAHDCFKKVLHSRDFLSQNSSMRKDMKVYQPLPHTTFQSRDGLIKPWEWIADILIILNTLDILDGSVKVGLDKKRQIVLKLKTVFWFGYNPITLHPFAEQ